VCVFFCCVFLFVILICCLQMYSCLFAEVALFCKPITKYSVSLLTYTIWLDLSCVYSTCIQLCNLPLTFLALYFIIVSFFLSLFSLYLSFSLHISLTVVCLCLYGNKLCMLWSINFKTWNYKTWTLGRSTCVTPTSVSNRVPCSISRGYPSMRKPLLSTALANIDSFNSCKTVSCNRFKAIVYNKRLTYSSRDYSIKPKLNYLGQSQTIKAKVWFRPKSSDSDQSQVIQTTVKWFRPRSSDTDYGQVIQTKVKWYRPRSSDTDHGQVIQTTVKWFRPKSSDTDHGQVIQTKVKWYRPRSSDLDQSQVIQTKVKWYRPRSGDSDQIQVIQTKVRWFRPKSGDSDHGQVIQTKVKWSRPKSSDPDQSQVIQTNVRWFRPKSGDSDQSQVIQTKVSWFRPKSSDSGQSQVIQAKVKWSRPKSSDPDQSQLIQSKMSDSDQVLVMVSLCFPQFLHCLNCCRDKFSTANELYFLM